MPRPEKRRNFFSALTLLYNTDIIKSEYYYIVQSTFTVLKTGRRFDGLVPCLQYEHKIVVKERPTATIKGNIITQETIIENACSITPDYQILPSGFMFYLTEAKYIIFFFLK